MLHASGKKRSALRKSLLSLTKSASNFESHFLGTHLACGMQFSPLPSIKCALGLFEASANPMSAPILRLLLHGAGQPWTYFWHTAQLPATPVLLGMSSSATLSQKRVNIIS